MDTESEIEIDVSVLVPVHNARPYLDRCLTSLLVQRVVKEIIVVDDASTDGSGDLLDLYAAHHRNEVRVLRHPRKLGAGRARNFALAEAGGRYVFFCEAADHLGKEALERMVAMADRNRSDIVLGKIVGPGAPVFQENADRVPLCDSAVYNSLSCFKLFRRETLERHHVRFDESLQVGEDVVFTTHAYCHADVISVLADYDCYHRDGGGTPEARDPIRWLRMIRRPIELMAGHVRPGPLRDHLLRRHFRLDALAQLGAPFLAADETRRREIADEVAELCERWLTDGVRDRLDEVDRRRLASLADIDRLVRLARIEAASVRRSLTEVCWEGDRLVVSGRVALDSLPAAGHDYDVSLVLRPRRMEEGLREQVFPVVRDGEAFVAALDVAALPSGAWDLLVAVEYEGVTRLARLGTERDQRIARPALRVLGDRVVLPYFTRSLGNLSLDVGGHVVTVPCGVRLTRASWGRGHRLLIDGRVTMEGDALGAGAVRRLVWRERGSGRERGQPVTVLPGGLFAARQRWGRFGPGTWDAYLELELGGPPVRFRIETGAQSPAPPRTWWRGPARRTVRPYATAGKGRLSAVVRIMTPRAVLRRMLH
ncbi:glycosyltransferase [Streptosporangium sp. KLBMP 9127]|nr:glycosyltransferase [Streptosporangium sp. KLBMP 9127]